MLWGNCERINNFTQETVMTKITPSAQLTLTKGNKSWELHRGGGRSRTSGSSGPWLSLTAAAFFFFFFFFFFTALFYAYFRRHSRSMTISRQMGELSCAL
eukprot:FR736514.1.p5 GENE.FR736514.1~~FR736514.1.p5  ORF type:complete len:100 (-),score=22.19 FR736514.1:547-846(-)